MKARTLACALLLLTACSGENREARLYGPNAHQIAGDTAPWNNPAFQNDQLTWDHQMEKRARMQNEYQRIR